MRIRNEDDLEQEGSDRLREAGFDSNGRPLSEARKPQLHDRALCLSGRRIEGLRQVRGVGGAVKHCVSGVLPSEIDQARDADDNLLTIMEASIER